MIVGEGTATVQATPEEVFDFVLDLRRYRNADHKIGRVGPIRREGNRGTAEFSGRVRGLPGPWRWIAEPFLRRWLEGDTVAEMARFKDLIDAEK